MYFSPPSSSKSFSLNRLISSISSKNESLPSIPSSLHNEIVREPPLSCSSVPHTPPHVLSIVDIYLAQPVIPRSSFYSPRAPKCLFRQDWFNYSHRQCTVQPPVCVFYSHRHLPYVSNDPNPPPINDPLPCISYPMRLIRINQSQRLDPFRTSNTQSTTAYSHSNFTKSLFQL